MRRFIINSLILTGLFVVASQSAQAQRPAHYTPARPTFSTYLLYRQFNATGIPNYYQFVRPENQYREFLQRTRPAPYEGRQQLSIEQEVARSIATLLRQRETTGIGQPAQAAAFGDTSHYFPPRVNRRRR